MSGKNKSLAIVLVIILFLACLMPVTALREDFDVKSQNSIINVCACSYAKNLINIKNKGDVTSVYEVSQENEAGSWTTITENEFTLKPWEEKQITQYVSVPCGQEGTFDIKTHINTIFELEKTIEQKIDIRACNNIEVSASSLTKTTCPCKPAEFLFTVHNSGAHFEKYTVSVTPMEHVSLSQTTLLIPPGESMDVVVFITKPCDVTGTFDYSLFVEGHGSNLIGEVPFSHVIGQCYDYALEGADSFMVCQDFENLMPITINNIADVANTFELSATIDEDDEFEYGSVFALPEQEIGFNMSVDATGVEVGEHLLTVTALSHRGQIEQQKQILMNTQLCDEFGNPITEELVEEEEESFMPWWGWLILGLLLLLLIILGLVLIFKKPSEDGDDILKKAPEEKEKKKLSLWQWLLIALILLLLLAGIGTMIYMIMFPSVNVLNIDEEGLNMDGNTVVVHPNETVEIPVIITNDDFNATYSLGFDTGLDWVSVDKTSAVVGPETEDLVIFTAFPTNDTERGVYNLVFDIEVQGLNETETITDEISISVEDDKPVNLLWLLIPLVLLIMLIIAGLLFLRKKKEGDKPKKEKKKKEKPLIKHGRKRSWKWLWILLLILLLLTGIAAGIYFIASAFGEEPVLNIEEEGLRMDGDAVVVRPNEVVDIPVTVVNDDPDSAYSLGLETGLDWLTADDDSVVVPADSSETVTLTASPTNETDEGTYNLVFEIDVEDQEEPLTDELTVKVEEEGGFWNKYWVWFLIPFIILLLLLILLFILIRRRKKTTGGDMKKIKKVKSDYTEPPKGYGKYKEEKKKGGFWKGFLLALLLLLLLAGIAGAIYYFTSVAPAAGYNETNATGFEEDVVQGETVEISTEEPINESNVVEVNGKKTVIPLRIQNTNENFTYRITVNEDVEWISVDHEVVDVEPMTVQTVYMTVDPKQGAEDGRYRVGVDVAIEGEEEASFTSDIYLDVDKFGFLGKLVSYLLYIVLGLVIAFLIIYLWATRKPKEKKTPSKRMKTEGSLKIKNAKKGKTNLQLK